MKKITCKILGHDLVKKTSKSPFVKEYVCTCCNKEFTEDGYGKIVYLDAFWKQNNQSLLSIKG